MCVCRARSLVRACVACGGRRIDEVLRRVQRQQEQEQTEQDFILSSLKTAGWHPSLPSYVGETDSEDESGAVPPA